MDEIECPKCCLRTDVDSPGEAEGEWTCEECGFKFIVEVEYEPTYWVTCKTHEYSPDARGLVSCKWCGQDPPEGD